MWWRNSAGVSVFLAFLNYRTYASVISHLRPKPYGTKTAYNISLTTSERDIIDNQDYLFAPSFCQPLHVNIVFRHGTRFPSRSDVVDFYTLHDKIHGKINNPMFIALNSTWKPIFELVDDDHKNLAPVGEEENLLFGHRFSERFASLLDAAASDELKFYSSHKERSVDSCYFFQRGYQSIHPHVDIINKTVIRDDLMRFFDHCQKYIEDVDDNPAASKEYKSFLNGPEVHGVAESLTKTLGLDSGITLNTVDAKAAYLSLAYEEGFTGSSLWEEVFTDPQLEIMEYCTDLKQWWKKGYGYPVNYEMSCPILSDAVHHMDAAVEAAQSRRSYTKGLFQFGHAETVMPFLALLGLFKDTTPPTAVSFEEHINRQFKTGLISPFAVNVGFVLYQCDTAAQVSPADLARKPPGVLWPEKFSEHMVQLILKESPLAFPWSKYHLVPLDDVKSHYAELIQCPLDRICNSSGSKSSLMFVVLGLGLLVVHSSG